MWAIKGNITHQKLGKLCQPTTAVKHFKDGLQRILAKTGQKGIITCRNGQKTSVMDTLLSTAGQDQYLKLLIEKATVVLEYHCEISHTNLKQVFSMLVSDNIANQAQDMCSAVSTFLECLTKEIYCEYHKFRNGYVHALGRSIAPLLQVYTDFVGYIDEGSILDRDNSHLKAVVYLVERIVDQTETHWQRECVMSSIREASNTQLLMLIWKECGNSPAQTFRESLLGLLESYVSRTHTFPCQTPAELLAKYRTLMHFSTQEAVHTLAVQLLKDDQHSLEINEEDSSGHTPLFYVKSAEVAQHILDNPQIIFSKVRNDAAGVVLALLQQQEQPANHGDMSWNGMAMCQTLLGCSQLGIQTSELCHDIVDTALDVCINLMNSAHHSADEFKDLIDKVLTGRTTQHVLNADVIFAKIHNSKQYQLFGVFQKYDALSSTSVECVNASDKDGKHLLQAMMDEKEEWPFIHCVLKIRNLDLNVVASNGSTIFLSAIDSANEDVVETIIDHPHFNLCTSARDKMQSIIHIVISKKMSVYILKRLLQIQGLDADIKDACGRTPLSYAYENQDWDVVLELCHHEKVDINVSDLPHWLIGQQDSSVLSTILKHQPHKMIDLSSRDSYGNTVLHIAARKSSVSLFRSLLSDAAIHPVNLNAQNNNLEGVLHLALEKFCSLSESRDWRGTSNESWVLRQKELVLFLLDQPTAINVNVQDLKGNAAIHIILSVNATSKHVIDVQNRLLDRPDLDLTLANIHGNSVLHFAAQFNPIETVSMKILSETVHAINDVNCKGLSALQVAVRTGNYAFAKTLLSFKETDPNVTVYRDNLLFYCITYNDYSLFDAVVHHSRLMVNAINSSGDSALHIIIKQKIPSDTASHHMHNVKYLHTLNKLLAHKDIDINIVDNKGYTPLQEAIIRNNIYLMAPFLSHAACDVTRKDQNGQPLVFHALQCLAPRYIRIFLQHPSFNAGIENEYAQGINDIFDNLEDGKKLPKLKSLITHAVQNCPIVPDGGIGQIRHHLRQIDTIITTRDISQDEENKEQLQQRVVCFRDALNRMERMNLGKEAYQPGMCVQHQEVLIKNREFLLEEIEPGDILHRLLQDFIIKLDTYEQIEVEKTRKAKVTVLLNILPHCGPNAFQSFMNALNKSQHHVAEALQNSPGFIREGCQAPVVQGAPCLPKVLPMMGH